MFASKSGCTSYLYKTMTKECRMYVMKCMSRRKYARVYKYILVNTNQKNELIINTYLYDHKIFKHTII